MKDKLLAAAATIGYAEWPVIKQIAWVFGLLMQGIFIVLSNMGIYSVTVCIVVFTVITKMLLLPLTVKQQRSTRVNQYVTPEIQAIQKKYEGQRDQVSMAKMQAEQQAVYDKYGTSMSAGCLPTLIQLPLLFGLYPVIYSLENYVPQMAQYTEAERAAMYSLFGINLLEAPGWRLTPALIIPILSGLFSFLSSKLTTPKGPEQKDNSAAASNMKMMTYMMPLFSAVICVTLPAFLGVYWVTQSLVMAVQQYFINRKLEKIPIEQMIKENIEKVNKKRAKKGQPPLTDKATINTRRIDDARKAVQAEQDAVERENKMKASTEYYRSKGGSGSLASKANMVKEYNERNKK